MKREYDIEKMNPKSNPYAKTLKEQRLKECEEVTFWIKKETFDNFTEALQKQGKSYDEVMTDLISTYISK